MLSNRVNATIQLFMKSLKPTIRAQNQLGPSEIRSTTDRRVNKCGCAGEKHIILLYHPSLWKLFVAPLPSFKRFATAELRATARLHIVANPSMKGTRQPLGPDRASLRHLQRFGLTNRPACTSHEWRKRGAQPVQAERHRNRDPDEAYRPSKMLSSRQHLAERKAKQAGYVALRGPGQDVLPSQRDREQREAGEASAGGTPAGSNAPPPAPTGKTSAAAKAAARRGAGPGVRLQGPPVPTIAPGQVLA